jgi:flagellar basal-body rod protein FlgC
MSFLDSFDISASGLSAQRVRMDVAAENIANVNTTRTESGGAYRRKEVALESFGTTESFQSVLSRTAEQSGKLPKGTARKSGVRVSEIVDDPTENKKVYNPTHPDADADGYVEMPNVDVLKETVDTMDATRSYEANVTVLNALKAMTQKAMEIK